MCAFLKQERSRGPGSGVYAVGCSLYMDPADREKLHTIPTARFRLSLNTQSTIAVADLAGLSAISLDADIHTQASLRPSGGCTHNIVVD